MYEKSALYYDIIYSFKNYKKESEIIDRFIKRYKRTSGKSLLDVACGTGNHIAYLKRKYSVEGLDIDPVMLKQARRKHPDVKFYLDDATRFKLPKRYDVITCLFSAIGHVRTLPRLHRAVARMAAHLKPGGLLLLEPWFTPKQWTLNHVSVNLAKESILRVVRVGISKRKARLSINILHYLIGSPGRIEHFVENLVMGLFTQSEYLGAFRAAGLKVSLDKKGLIGRGLYLGLKPAD